MAWRVKTGIVDKSSNSDKNYRKGDILINSKIEKYFSTPKHRSQSSLASKSKTFLSGIDECIIIGMKDSH
jgi:hypothetical protein